MAAAIRVSPCLSFFPPLWGITRQREWEAIITSLMWAACVSHLQKKKKKGTRTPDHRTHYGYIVLNLLSDVAGVCRMMYGVIRPYDCSLTQWHDESGHSALGSMLQSLSVVKAGWWRHVITHWFTRKSPGSNLSIISLGKRRRERETQNGSERGTDGEW